MRTPGAGLGSGTPAHPTSEDATIASTGGLRSAVSRSTPGFGPGQRPPIFEPDQLIAGRYRIVRFLAQGGMGEVYEAVDQELLQEVALKTVSADIGHEPAAVERFKREIALARRVTHPNVCRIFDLGQHLPESGFSEPITFLTMELLRGETLSSALRQRDRLTSTESLPLIQQMASALDAAHRARVVHRDFKSENVYLVHDEGTDPTDLSQRRVVVTDFGIARGSDSSDRFAAQVTGLGIVGTPAYMAPEQVENAPEITSAADIYAFGIVIYEMVTGHLPFEGGNPLTTAVKRLQQPPPPPHVHVPDLPAWWERTILRCLERQPADRFDTALEVAQALETPLRGPRPGTAMDLGTPASAASVPAASAADSSTPGHPAAEANPRAATGTSHTGQPHAGTATSFDGQGIPPTDVSSGAAATAKPSGVGTLVGSLTQSPADPAAARRTRRLLLALALVVAVSAILMWTNRGELDPSKVQLRQTVAVLGFHNVTGREEADWVSTALVEMLSTELDRGKALRSVPGDQVAAARRQMSLEITADPDVESLIQLRQLLGCDYVVAGSYVSLPAGNGAENLRLDLRLLDAALGQGVTSLSQEGMSGELFGMINRLGTGLREALGVSAESGEDPLAGVPQNPDAARHYAKALDLMRDFQPEEARNELEQALGSEPDNPLIHSALSSAWDALGYSQKAADEARRAFELSSGLPQEDRLSIEGRLRQVEGDWTAAREVYRKLWESFPDNLDYGLGLVAAETASGEPGLALSTVDQLRRLPSPLSEDPRIDLEEAAAAGAAGKVERQAGAASQAMTKAGASGAKQMEARALLSVAQAERVLGRPELARDAAERALQLFLELDHPPGHADALTARANAYFDRGDFEEAAAGYEAAVEVHRSTGDRGGQAASLNNLAVVRKRQGDLGGADQLYAQTEALYRETDDARGLAVALNNRAVILVEYDRLDEAMAMFESTQETWEAIGGVAGKAYALNNIAEVYRLRGQLEESLERHQEALRIRSQANLELDRLLSLANLGALHLARGDAAEAEKFLVEARQLAEKTGERATLAQVHFEQGNLLLAQGLLAPARKEHQAALQIRTDLGQITRLTSSQIALARLEIIEGVPSEAEALALVAHLDSRTDGRAADEAMASAVLIEAWLDQNRVDDARSLAAESQALVESSNQPAVRLGLGRALALVEALDSPTVAIEKLDILADEAASLGLALVELDLHLAAAKISRRVGPTDETRQRLEQIRDSATRQGLQLYADRVAALPSPDNAG